MAITPLRFYRRIMFDDGGVVISDSNHDGSSCVIGRSAVYGRGEYVSNDGRFHIKQTAKGWKVRTSFQMEDSDKVYQSFKKSGIKKIRFERRRDLVAVLETFLEGEGVEL